MSLPTKAVKAVVKNKEGAVLFLQRNPKKSGVDNWDLPGGLIEEGESGEEALKRECLEELGVEIEVLKKSGQWKFFRDFDERWVEVQNYDCRITSSKELKLSDEHIGFKWLKNFSNLPIKDKSLFGVL